MSLTAEAIEQVSAFGPWRCATIACSDVDAAAALYLRALGFDLVEEGTISAEVAASWGAPGLANAHYALVGPDSGDFFIRFVEQALVPSYTPYLTKGWTALEFTVENSDEAMERLCKEGFRVLGEAEDLDFAEGALRAGQVVGPFGEVLYLTQVNRQIDDFMLPHARVPVDRMFICILATDDMQACVDHYGTAFGCAEKPSFEAAVPFIAEYQGIDPKTQFTVGTVELQPENYIEVDGLPGGIGERLRPDGLFPAGIAMVTVVGSTGDQRLLDRAISTTAKGHGLAYAGEPSIVLAGYSGELIEVVGA